jgi:hypothetical protein
MELVIKKGTATDAVAPAVLGEAITAPPVSDPPVIAAWTGVTLEAVARTVVPSAARVLIAPAP